MKYKRQIEEIENYLRNREKNRDEYRVGVEFEHFIIDKDTLESKTYYDEDGIESTLKEFEKRGWTGDYEEGYLLGVHKGNKVITLEPGSQFEFSVEARENISEIEAEYEEFILEVREILDKKNQTLVSVGYHPRTKIEDIKLLPKKRYDYMFNYFIDKGKMAHNMMKGSAALQVSLDYSNEEDYRRKMRIANGMGPIMYCLCDNTYYFQGEEYGEYGLRTKIWENMDDARSGIILGALEDDFSYRSYAEYILNVPPIFIMKDGKAISTGSKKMRELFDPDNYKVEELEHMMTMVFPDVRTKGFIEIRMMDSIPYPYNFGIISLLTGLFYNEENVDELYEIFKVVREEDIIKGKEEVMKKGIKGEFLNKSFRDWGLELFKLARRGISKEEEKYIVLWEELLEANKNPYELIREKAEKGRKEALSHCILEDFEVI